MTSRRTLFQSPSTSTYTKKTQRPYGTSSFIETTHFHSPPPLQILAPCRNRNTAAGKLPTALAAAAKGMSFRVAHRKESGSVKATLTDWGRGPARTLTAEALPRLRKGCGTNVASISG